MTAAVLSDTVNDELPYLFYSLIIIVYLAVEALGKFSWIDMPTGEQPLRRLLKRSLC